MCAIPIHSFFTIVFCLFATFLQTQICNAAEKDSIFWLFSNEGSLRRNAPSGTVVQFDGPMRINPALSDETNLVNLHMSEPFLLRQHFNITPSSSISAGQSFKLILTRPLLPQHSMLDFIKLTIQAQIMPNSFNNNEQEKQQIVMKIEEKEIKINLFGDADGNEAAEKLANGMLHKRIHMKRDEKNCTIYKNLAWITLTQKFIEPIATRKQQFASPSYRLIGPYSKSFQIHNETSSIDDSIKIDYNGPAKCAPSIAAKDGKLQILASFLNSFGSLEIEIWSLEESEAMEEKFPDEKEIHFIRKEFNVEFQPSLHVLKPQLILLSELESGDHILAANNNPFEFKLEMNETTDGILNIHPHTGVIFINDSERLLTLFQSNGESIQIIALLLLNGKIMDRAIINLRIDEQNWKRPRKTPNELIKFERPIYAFAIDPYNLNKFGDGNEEQILIGKLETKPKLNEENENLAEFIISEGGGGLFKFSNSKNRSTKNSLIYSGPMSQFPRNYTLKVLLISADEFIDTAIVHILIAGIGSSPPIFQRSFQRIIVSKYNNDFFAESPQQNDSKELFTLSADDTDPDAHLSYALEGTKCRNFEGTILPEFQCSNAFLLSPNGTTGQWVLSLMENESEQQQQIAEALMNISVRDEAHPLEMQAHTLVLLKFIQKLNATNENEVNNNNGIIEENNNLNLIDQNFTLHLLDSMPVNSVIYSFGGLPPKMGKMPNTLRYSLSGQFSKYFSIGRESGILSIALPLRNIIGRHQLTINVHNNSTGKQIVQKFNPILEIASSIPKWHKMENYYELEDDKFVNLGREFSNTLNDIELLMPSMNGTNEKRQIKADENGTLNLTPIFDAQFAEDRSSNFFAVFNKTNIDMSSIISIHRELPMSTMNFLSFSNMPISSLPSSPIRLPENSPIGTYVLSMDFITPPQTSEFIIHQKIPSQINSTIEFLSIEKRANSILLRTNQTLKGIMMEQNPMEFILQQNDKEIGQFSVEIIPITNCQPRFKAGQKLVISIPEETISSHQQSADVSTQWFPIGTILAEMAKTNGVNECDSIKYSIDRIGRNEQDNSKLESAIKIDSHTGMISANPLILGNEDIFEGIPLTIKAQNGPKYAEQIRILLKVNRQISPNKNSLSPKFMGISPILLEIEEGNPVGTLLTTLKAYSANGTREVQKYRLEGPDTDLLEIDSTNGELKTKHELDYETLVNDRQLPLQMLAIAEVEEGGEDAAEMEIRLNIIDINDNFPEFTNPIYDFVVEKDAPIGWQLGIVKAEDADPSTKNLSLRILSCDFNFGRFSRQIFPTDRIFKFDPSNGAIYLAASVDDSTGGHFILQLEAEDDGGRRSKQNGTANIWVVHSVDIVSIVVRKSAVELDAKELNEYLKSLSSKTNLKPILHEVRYYLDADGQPIRQSSVLQLVFLNQTHILTYEEAELALKDLNIKGMDGFEQNLFHPSLSSSISKAHSSSSKNATNNANSHLLSLSLLFLFLLATILSVLGVLICQHRRRHIAERHLADALKSIRQSSISKSDTLDKSTTIHSPYYFLPPTQIGDIWRRPLPPPPILPSLLPPPPPSMLHHHPTSIPIIQQPTGTDGGGSFYTQHSHQNSGYYTVQEMKIAL